MDIREIVFKSRGFIPVPFALVTLYQSNMTKWGIAIGAVLLMSGEWLRISGVRCAGGRTRTRNVGAKELCTWGPFAYVRNPLYLGNFAIYTGMILFAGGPWIITILIISLILIPTQYGLIISLEEETLSKLFESEYEEYCSNVPRLIPNLKPWKKQTVSKVLSCKKVIHTERRTLQVIITFMTALILKEIFINVFHAFG